MKERNLEVVLEALAETIDSLKFDIYIRDSRIADLEKKLAEATKGESADGTEN